MKNIKFQIQNDIGNEIYNYNKGKNTSTIYDCLMFRLLGEYYLPGFQHVHPVTGLLNLDDQGISSL